MPAIYSKFATDLQAKLDDFKERYPKATGYDKYMIGRRIGEYRLFTWQREQNIHDILANYNGDYVCVCSLVIPDDHSVAEAKGHLDPSGNPTSQFFVPGPKPEISFICQICFTPTPTALDQEENPITPEHICEPETDNSLQTTYLQSNILIGHLDGTTWLLTDQTPKNEQEQTPLQTTTFVITACNPGSKRATLAQNHANTLLLEQDLIRNGLEYQLGWGSDEPGLHAELSFCISITNPEAVDATRHLLTELAKDHGQNALFEVEGSKVTLLPARINVTGTTTKHAIKLAEPQSELKQKLNALRWIPEITEREYQGIQSISNERTGE